ncbi:precorrin-4 C(11)-methyltransferase [Proteinivorax tanatarense]|uniref:Precorrin-4 C(11)-methyltransferase n=1 Tax=Proteinivorax tanatarense TaxID=1260629 RepID=A0AAU7VJS7_9FIRM
MGKIFFVGAGPGDPELITVKGRKIIEQADVIIYTGSLVNKEVISCRKKTCKALNSASMTLKEVITEIKQAVEQKQSVVRLHTGDPTLYGAIREQIDILEKLNIDCEVVPGVSSFTAAAATMNKELTLPGVTQTVICTRIEGKTPVPKLENLDELAKHKATMAIFLSVQSIDKVVEKLSKYYSASTPIAVVQKASWDDEKVVVGTLNDIEEKVKKAGIYKTAQILVGDFLGNNYSFSKLYDENFRHEYRRGSH